MDERVYKLLNWESNDGKTERAVIDIENHDDRKFFWNYWHKNKDYLKANGFSINKESDDAFYMYHVFTDEQIRIKEEKEKTKELSRSKTSSIEVPAPDNLNYFPYQRSGIEFIVNRDATLLGDEPGLGKTLEVAGSINWWNANKTPIKKALIICPASLRINWKRELDKWLVDKYNVGVVNRSDYPENADIVVINYDVVSKHYDKLSLIDWDLLVLDEAHYLKNSNSKRTKYIFGNKKNNISPIKANKKVFLTGTPMLNRPIELFPLLHALDSESWPNQWKFAHRYCDAKHNGYGWDFSGASNLEELQDTLRSTLMIRRTKKEVLPELPGKFRQIIELPFTPKIKKLLDAENSEWENREELLSNLKASVLLSRVNEDSDEYKESVSKLKKGVAAGFGEIAKLREKIALSKVPYVIEHLKDIEGKVVVFAHHKSVVQELHKAFGEESVMLVGDTRMDERQEAVDRFQTDSGVKYFIGSIMAAGVGITLTSSSHVVFAELDWVPGIMSQCEDRCARIGQKNNVLVQHLVLEGSLDARIAKILVDKQDVIDKALDLEYSFSEPSIPDEVLVLPPEKEFKKESANVSDNEKLLLLKKLKFLVSFDEDKAAYSNGVGFNKIDSKIGESLSSQLFLTNRQAVLAKKLLKKYENQLVRLGFNENE